jgi:predicted signal transduction protein with EAL and GGDEF domain
MSALKHMVSGHQAVWRFFTPLEGMNAALCAAVETLPRWSLGAVKPDRIECIRTTNSGFVDDITLLLVMEEASDATLVNFHAINR